MSQGTSESNSDLTLLVSDNPDVQRSQVIVAWNRHVEKHDLAGKLILIAKKLDAAILRLQRREGWSAGLTMLSLDYVVGGYSTEMYNAALALQTEEDGGGNGNGNSTQSGRSGKRRKRTGGQVVGRRGRVQSGVEAVGEGSGSGDDGPGAGG